MDSPPSSAVKTGCANSVRLLSLRSPLVNEATYHSFLPLCDHDTRFNKAAFK